MVSTISILDSFVLPPSHQPECFQLMPSLFDVSHNISLLLAFVPTSHHPTRKELYVSQGASLP